MARLKSNVLVEGFSGRIDRLLIIPGSLTH